MANAYFAPAGSDASGQRFRADPATAGPWDARLEHGGPPGALLVRIAESCAAHETGRTDLVAMRFAAEFVGPVPVDEIHVTSRIVRSARSGVLVALSLSAQGRICLDGRAWLVRHADTSAIAAPEPDTPVLESHRGLGMSFPYADSIEWHAERGSLVEPGPGTMWARPRIPLIEGEAMSGLQRAVLIGDSASGVSAELDWNAWTFLNVDLDVHLARPVRGEWLRMEAVTQLGNSGSGLARSTLSDEAGPVGATAQTLVLTPRATAGANVP